MPHLTPEEVSGCLAGEAQSPRIAEHLTRCPRCRAEVREKRVLAMLTSRAAGMATGRADDRSSRPAPVAAGSRFGRHPSPEMLVAYYGEALSAEQSRQVQAHLRECDRCAAQILRIQRAAAGAPGASAPRALFEQVKQQLPRQAPLRPAPLDVGKLFLEVVDDLRLRLTYRPAPSARRFLARPSMAPSPALGFVAPLSASPAAPSEGVPPGRLRRRPPAVSRSARVERLREREPAYGLSSSPPASAPVTVDLENARLVIRASPVPGGTTLSILATNPVGTAPLPGISLSVTSEAGPGQQANTDEEGQVELTFRGDQATLEIGTDPPALLTLQRVP